MPFTVTLFLNEDVVGGEEIRFVSAENQR